MLFMSRFRTVQQLEKKPTNLVTFAYLSALVFWEEHEVTHWGLYRHLWILYKLTFQKKTNRSVTTELDAFIATISYLVS